MYRCPDRSVPRRSMALVVVLAMVAILSLTVVAFVTTVRFDHSASFSYSQSFKADQLAEGGAWWMVKELREEIASGGAPDAGGAVPVYTNVTAANVAPRPVGTNGAMPSLVKISLGGTPSYPGGIVPSSVGTATRSLDGRAVSAARWNAASFGAFPSGGPLPSWIIVTRSGPASVTDMSQLKDITGTNYAIGRFAYAIYDEGGLIDINVAGHPATFGDGGTLSALDAARRGSPGLMDLTAIPGVDSTALDALLRWRSAASGASTNAFLGACWPTNETLTNLDAVIQSTNVAAGTTNVFTYLHVTNGDNAFLSRQDLIAYAQAHDLTNALPYLTTFSRDLNAPTFVPAATNLSGLSPAAFPTAYPNQVNTNVLQVRDASTQQPLVRQRFPLVRLGLFDNAAANAALIQTNFGLTRDADGYSWDYRSKTTVLTLAQVAAQKRDPDFFELLQAAVLQGSLVPYNQPYSNKPNPPQLPTAPMIMKMGADLIDQYDADDMPTVINFNGEKLTGVENLPYFNELLFWPYRPTSDSSRATLEGLLLVEMWNPHQNATNAPASGPSQLRCLLMTSDQSQGLALQVRAAGAQVVMTNAAGAYQAIAAATNVNPTLLSYPASQSTNPPAFVVFNNSTIFSEPHLVDASTASAGASSPSWSGISEAAGNRGGFLILSNSLPDARVMSPPPPINSTNMIWTNMTAMIDASASANNMGVRMEFKDSKGNWQPYQGGNPGVNVATNFTQTFFGNFQSGIGAIIAGDRQVSPLPPAGVSAANIAAYTNFSYVAPRSFFFSDPRSLWPGYAEGDSTVNQTIRPTTTSAGAKVAANYPPIAATNNYSFPTGVNGAGIYSPYAPYPALYNENATTNPFTAANGLGATNTYFRDSDGILRGGDGYYGSNPFLSGAATNRPVLLNRPFRSVGEMGFAFRGGGPWKTVDFFTTNSADAGLLDYFSADASPLVEGRINLNTRQPVTLQAAMQGAYKTLDANPVVLTPLESSNLAAAITNATAQAAFVNRADLVRSFAANPAFPDTIKTRREAAVRALGDLGTTRSWNLMIDVVAQVGHYPPTATDPAQFVVEGERRYWLHVAIDRYTGQVIDSKMEPYQE